MDTATGGTDSASGSGDVSGGVQRDGCTGLDRQACFDEQQLGNCEPVWGTPYTEVRNQPGDWCLFANGVEYLGCREADACAPAPNGVIICDGQGSWWQLTLDCLPAEIDVTECDPPGNVIGLC